MKQEKLPKWLRMKWRKRMEAMAMVTALVVTGSCPITALAEEGAVVGTEEENQEEEISEQEDLSEQMVDEEAVAFAESMVNAPVGLVVDSPSEKVLTVVYGPSFTEGVVRYIIYLDGKAIKEDAGVAFYTFEDVEPGKHKVQVTAVLEDGTESEPEGCEAVVTVQGEETSSEEESTTEEETSEETQQGDFINLAEADTTLWCGGNDGWADAFAQVDENGEKAVIKASNFGNQDANEWAIQYKIAGVEVTKGTEYTLSCELVSDVDKEVTLKLHDEGEGVIFERITLKAGEVYRFEKTAKEMPANQTQLILALGKQGSDSLNQSGTVTLSKVALTKAKSEEEKPDDKPVEFKGDVVAISESKESVTCGEAVTLTFHENEDFSEAITAVLVNGEEVNFDKDSHSITISGSYFSKAGVYHIEVKAEGYATASVYQQIFEDDIWELVFSDEFEGNELNRDVWSYQNGTGAEYGLNGWGNDEEQYYTSDNLRVDNGTLTIEAKKESVDGKNYTSGRIRSLAEDNQGFSTTYGRIEAKIKMPAGEGIWPAFWMLPSTDIYGTWASNGEIDIMEARGRLTNQVLGTIHYGETWPNNKSAGVTYELPDNGSITDYHLYALEWDVDSLTWYVDGVEIKKITNWYAKGSGNAANYAYPAPFDAPFHIVLNMAVGGTFDGGRRPADSIFEQPVEMDVDYVRVYRNHTEGYYDRDVEEPKQETDEQVFEAWKKKYADTEGNFIEDAEYTNVEKASGVVSTDMNDNWSRHWYYLLGDYQGAATFQVTQIDGETYAQTDITNGGSQNYAIQLIQHLPLVKCYTYEVSFDAFASKNRDMIVKLAGDDDNGWGAYSNAFTVPLKTEPQHYTYTFTMNSDSDETARLEYNMGLDTGKISIANVSVKAVEAADNTNSAKEPLEDGNHIYNGTFDQGTGKLAFWNLDEEAKAAGSIVTSDKVFAWKAGALEQNGIQLLQSDKYKLILQAAGEGETLTVALKEKTGNKVYAEEKYALNSKMDSYELVFEMPKNVTDKESVLHMETTGSITLDNIVMKRLTDNNVSYDDVKIYPLSNGDFEDGTTGWTEYTDGGAGCATAPVIEQEGNNHCIAVHGAKGAQTYFNMLMREGVQLKQGMKYDISFKAKATSEQNLEVKIENASYTSTLAESFTVGTQWQEYSFTFKSGLEGDTTLKYLLAGVTEPTTIYLDDVVIKVSGVDSKVAPVLTSKESVKQGKEVVLTYAEDAAWEKATKRVLVSGEELDSSLYTMDTKANTITIAAKAFTEAKLYTIKVIAEGYDYTQVNQTVIATTITESGNVVPHFSEWTHYVGRDWAYVDSMIVSQKENSTELMVKADGGWSDTAWGVQLFKADIPVNVGYPYTVSFQIKSEQNKKFAFKAEGADSEQLFYQEYSLEAGVAQTITIELEEMSTEFVKLYFALGVFADEKNVDTVISISNLEMCSALETDDEDETGKEPEKQPTRNPSQNVANKEGSNSDQEDTSKQLPQVKQAVVKVEDKLANVIFDSTVPLAATPNGKINSERYDLSLYGTDGVLTVADLMKIKHRSMILNAFLSDKMAVTLSPANFTNTMANLNLGMERDDTIDYGQGFSSVTFIPKNPSKIGYEVTIHLGIGAEHAGKTAYLFAIDLSTGELVCRQTSVINTIGNIAYTTDEYSFMVVLY